MTNQTSGVHMALWEPEIPPNTGNIARLCAATGSPLHIVGRTGFRMDDRSLRRAGLDYWSAVEMHVHDSLEAFELAVQNFNPPGRIVCCSAHAERSFTSFTYEPGDFLLFGSESRGLPAETLKRHAERVLKVPMLTGNVRSLNLATAAGIVLYEAIRQLHKW